MHNYYYSFGSSPEFPYQNGWVEVHADSWDEADEKFRTRFPDKHKGILNCAFFYDEDTWTEMDPEHTWPNNKCHEIIE